MNKSGKLVEDSYSFSNQSWNVTLHRSQSFIGTYKGTYDYDKTAPNAGILKVKASRVDGGGNPIRTEEWTMQLQFTSSRAAMATCFIKETVVSSGATYTASYTVNFTLY